MRNNHTQNGPLPAVTLVVAMMALAVGLIGNVVVYRQTQINRTYALDLLEERCAQRADIDKRIAADKRGIARTARILRENPGPLVFAIPRELLEAGLREDKADLRATQETRANLATLDCR
jgi:hypothetical protein